MKEIIKQAIIENICVRALSEKEAENEDWWFELMPSYHRKFTLNFDVMAKEIENRLKKEKGETDGKSDDTRI